ncbi:MAG: serine hydrolase [Gemmatimonadota bacterium]|nr:serine hydrolase [Gemmatimonadota bacterium]
MTSSNLFRTENGRTPGYARPIPLHWWAAADAVVLLVFLGAASVAPAQHAPEPARPDISLPAISVPTPVFETAPARVRVDQARLDRALARADELTPVSSLLVRQGGEMIVERYYRGMTASRTTNMKSVSKTLLSPLIGIAIRDGLLAGPDEPLSELFPDYWQRLEGAGVEDAKRRLTLHHVLSMTTGIESTSFGNYGAWVSSRDWVWDQLRRPMVCRPGCFEYSTGNTHLLSAALSERSGTSLRSYAREQFFGPLGIALPEWDRDPQGRYLGGNNMALTPRDLMKVGEVFLAGGRWEGRQLVPEEWIELSWRPRATSPWNGHRYGYLWWSDHWGGHTAYFAWGYGGQYLVLVPDLGLVAVVTSSLSRTQRGHTRRLRDFFDDYLIPAFAG